MIKGRRTSPDTGVGSFGGEVASNADDERPGEETGVLRWRGGGTLLSLDEDALLSDGGKGRASGELAIGSVGGTVEMDGSRTVVDGETCGCAD